MKITIIRTSDAADKNYNYLACFAILKDNQNAFSVIDNRSAALHLAKGKIHPADGFVINIEIINCEPVLLFNWMQLAKWIDDRGLKLL